MILFGFLCRILSVSLYLFGLFSLCYLSYFSCPDSVLRAMLYMSLFLQSLGCTVHFLVCTLSCVLHTLGFLLCLFYLSRLDRSPDVSSVPWLYSRGFCPLLVSSRLVSFLVSSCPESSFPLIRLALLDRSFLRLLRGISLCCIQLPLWFPLAPLAGPYCSLPFCLLYKIFKLIFHINSILSCFVLILKRDINTLIILIDSGVLNTPFCVLSWHSGLPSCYSVVSCLLFHSYWHFWHLLCLFSPSSCFSWDSVPSCLFFRADFLSFSFSLLTCLCVSSLFFLLAASPSCGSFYVSSFFLLSTYVCALVCRLLVFVCWLFCCLGGWMIEILKSLRIYARVTV